MDNQVPDDLKQAMFDGIGADFDSGKKKHSRRNSNLIIPKKRRVNSL